MQKILIILTLLPVIYCSVYKLDICDEETSVDISGGTRLENGQIIHNGVTYGIDQFYFDNATGVQRGCVCKKEHCLRKCCPSGYGYNVKTKVCVRVEDSFNPPVWESRFNQSVMSVNASELFKFIPGKINCTLPKKRIRAGKRELHIQSDGRLYISLPGSIPPWFIKEPEEYCIDTFVYEDSTGERTSQLDALLCFAEKQEENHYILTSTGMLISCVFILATVAVYIWLPELHNLHGRVLMAYLLSLFVAFIFLAVMQILLTVNNISVNTCLVLTFLIYFFLLAAFFWLNVMCFDIWWTFSGKGGMSLEKLSIRARLLAYCLYAFGIPTVLTVLLIALEFSGLPPHPMLPLIRQQGCFIYGPSKLLYLYGPITILCIANLTFFVLTAMKITQIKKQTSVLKSKESSTHDQHRNDKQRLLLYIKLFVVMGFNWILEVISALYPDAEVFWRFTDTYNVLIGLIVFIIFVCKRKIFKLIKKRYKQLRGDPMSRTQMTTSTHTYTSRDEMPLGTVKSK